MPETYIPTFRTSRPTNGLQAILPPKWAVPASTTQTQIPSKYAYQPKPTFGQLLTSIQDMDSLVELSRWHNYIQRERALELARVLRDFGSYSQLHWRLTSGEANPYLSFLVRRKFPDYPNFYSKKGFFSQIIIPGTNVEFDVPHFNATLSKYLDRDIYRNNIPADWAGWVGDMFTYARDLESEVKKNPISLDSMYRKASGSIGTKDTTFKHSFGPSDFYADIDARNISTLIHNGLSYHDAMDNYYNNNLYGRFGHFIDSYGGWKNFERHVNRFNFFPLTPFVNPIFIDAAKRAFINKIREGCLNEMGCYIP